MNKTDYSLSFVEVSTRAPGKVAVYQRLPKEPAQAGCILMCHATGFHARCWDEVVRLLPEDRHIVLLDTRCHGQSSNLEPPFEWNDFTADLVEVIEALGLEDIEGVGHSMGGHIILRAAGRLPNLFKRVIALDPIIIAEDMPKMKDLVPEGYEHPVAKRRDNWNSSEEMFESFKNKEPFSKWVEAVLKDYCDYALLDNEEGKRLACPPHMEGHIYLTPDSDAAYTELGDVECETLIVRARDRLESDPPFSFEPSPTNPSLATYFKNGRDFKLKDTSHFVPMEIPQEVATLIQGEDISPEYLLK